MNRGGTLLPAAWSQTPVSSRDGQPYEGRRMAASSANGGAPARTRTGTATVMSRALYLKLRVQEGETGAAIENRTR